MKVLSRFWSKLAALALLGLIASMAWITGIQPAFDAVRKTSEELHQKQVQKSRLTASIASLEHEIKDLTGGELEGVVWKAEQSGELTAQIQARLGDMASSNGVNLRSITPTGTREMPSTHATVLRVEGEATLDQLTAFLQELEFHTPVLMVERATLRRLNRPGQNLAQPLVFVQLEVLAPSRIAEANQ